MHRRLSLYGLMLIGIACFSLITLSRRHNAKDENPPDSVLVRESVEHVNLQRSGIELEMEGYPYEILSGRNVSKLSDLVIETGGKPVRSVILSTWRSGASFFSDLIASHPANYYIFEPLLGVFGTSRLKSPLFSLKPLQMLQSLLECNFESHDELLLNFRQDVDWKSIDRDRYLSKIGREKTSLPLCRQFFTRFCSLFPFQTVKIVSLDLASMKYFLENKTLGLKLVYLVRDPRGVMNSRKGLDWCEATPDCLDSAAFCSDLFSDYVTAIEFSKKYPDTFKVLRYEDFANDPEKMSRKIYAFYGMTYHEDVKRFLNTRTKKSHGNAYSTFRNTSSVVYKWKKGLSFPQVHKIQKHCHKAMKVWGYDLAIDSGHQTTFHPLKLFPTGEINHF